MLSNEANLLVQPPQVPDHPVTLDLFAPAASDVAVTPGRPVVSRVLPILLNPVAGKETNIFSHSPTLPSPPEYP